MKARIGLLCCAFLLALAPAAWAAPGAPTPADCAKNLELASFEAPQPLTERDIEKLSPLAEAQQVQSTDCCTQQDWDQCYLNVQEGCWVQSFYCYRGDCYCWYQCW